MSVRWAFTVAAPIDRAFCVFDPPGGWGVLLEQDAEAAAGR